jgi:outer membrane protein OmpA-like peptidoglycan-associated protein
VPLRSISILTRLPFDGPRASRRLLGLALGLALVSLGPGCETLPGSKTQQGAVMGGIAGAAAGRAIGGHDNAATGILLGGLAGAAAGGLLGRYLDNQAEELDAIPDANVEQQADRLLVTFSGDFLFASGSSSLSAGAQQRLAQVADTLKRYPETEVIVKGYTDSQGAESLNLRLSEDRANNVRNYLVGLGVAAYRVTALGFGEQFPVTPNDTEAGRLQNRRVELELIPEQDRLRGDTGRY